MNEEEYQKLRNDLLPRSVLEHFEQARKNHENNKKAFEKIGKPVSYATEGENALLKIITTIGNQHEQALDVLFRDVELAYVSNMVLRKKVERIKNTLNQQGTDIDRFSKYDPSLDFVDNYLKHSSKEGDE